MRRRTRAASLSAAMIAALALTACSSGSSGPPVLTWYINPDNGGQARYAAECTAEAGGRYIIETSLLPREASSQREQLARRLAAQDSSIDIMSLDPPFMPEFAVPGFLAPVPAEMQDLEGNTQGAIDAASWDGEVVSIPFWANTQLLWYRKSVAEAAGLDMTQPVTWDQIIEAAQAQGATIGAQGQKGESLTVWINALIESGGGHILENPEAPADELKLGLDTDAGREAARIMREISDSGLGGPGFTTANENSSMLLFQGDNGGFMVNWPFVYPATKDAAPEVFEDMGWAVYPQVSEGEPSAPPLGGIVLAVGAYSAHPDLAYEAVACITSVERQVDYFLTNGNPPAAEAAYDDPKMLEEFPGAQTIRDSLNQAAPRPQTPYYNEVSIGLQNTWHPISEIDPERTPATSTEFITEVLRGEALL